MKNQNSQRTHSNSYLLRRFLPYYKPHLGTLVLDLFCAILTTVCELYLPVIVREITDKGLNDIASLTVRGVLTTGAIYFALRIVDALANFYMTSVGHIMGARIETDMRRDFFTRLQNQSFSYYDETRVGQLMSRITSDLFDVTEFAHHCPEEFLIAGVKIIGAFVLLCFVNVPLTLIIFAALPLMMIVTRIFNRHMRRTQMESREKVGELNSAIQDSLLGIRVVKSFANEDIENEKFADGNKAFLRVKSRFDYIMGGFSTCNRLSEGFMYILVVVVGALFVIDRKIEVADLVFYLLYVTTLLNSIRRIVEFTEQFQRGMTGIERFVSVMDVPVDIEDAPDAIDLTDVRGDIEFDNVSFRYGGTESNVLTGIDLKARRGENIALVGPSGGGKTTLCSLIPRFYDVTGGSVKVDGHDVRTLTTASLRNNIGVVQQEVYLFSGTIRENIEYGKPGASHEQIVEAARKAGAHEFIEKLPDGYDTYIGERGVKLSGGQKQRLSIARVFLKDPPILILDEATSALDNESEHIVQQSLSELAVGRTTFTVAHRLTTIVNATEIIVLTEDGIAEKGTHADLLAKGGIYSSLYKMYSDMALPADSTAE